MFETSARTMCWSGSPSVMSSAALASLLAAAADCASHPAGFSPDEEVASIATADELRALFLPLASTRGSGALASAGVPPPAARPAVAADQAACTLLQLPAEVILLVGNASRLARAPARRSVGSRVGWYFVLLLCGGRWPARELWG